MLPQSILQKFTKKIQKLAMNQQSQRSQSQNDLENSSNSHDIPTAIYKKINGDKNKPGSVYSEQQEENQNAFQSDHQTRNGNSKISHKRTIGLDDDQELPKSQRIDSKQLTRLIELEKQKNKAASKSVSKPNTSQTIKKSIGRQLLPDKTTAPNGNSNGTATKPPLLMPKVLTMNNLVKLSTKLSCKQLLLEIKYQASLLNMAPIRLLLYVCIEKMLFSIYFTNGYEKILAKEKDITFIQKQIQSALVSLLGYLKSPQRTLVSRILRGVFNRLGIAQYFSQNWITDSIKKNRKAIQKLGVVVGTIEKMPSNLNITSDIFIGVVLSDKIVYDFPYLQLEDDQISKQRIQDPEVCHVEQKLFFFKKTFSRQKFGQQKPNKKSRQLPQKNNVNYKQLSQEDDQNNEQEFSIRISKLNVPSNAQVIASPKALLQNDNINSRITRTKSKEPKNTILVDDEDLIPKRRNRLNVPDKVLEEAKFDYNGESAEKQDSRKIFIQEIVQEYIFSNLDQIADKIASKWKIDPSQIRQLVRNSNESRSIPSKMGKNY